MSSCVLPINPAWLRPIFSGEQTLLPRRIMPRRVNPGDKLIFLAQRYLHGQAEVLSVHLFPPDDELASLAPLMGMTEGELVDYWRWARAPGYFRLGPSHIFTPARRWNSGFTPQFFFYL